MAIIWTTYKTTDGWKRDVESTRTSHEGMVVSASWTAEVRAMSDVYCDAGYVKVWDAEKQTTETVCLGYYFECCSTFGVAVVDASPEILAQVARQAEEAANLREAAYQVRLAAEREEARLADLNRPEMGKVMVVVKGRKVAKGTTGKVFWMRDGRVGLALDETKDARGRFANVAWVDACYLKAA